MVGRLVCSFKKRDEWITIFHVGFVGAAKSLDKSTWNPCHHLCSKPLKLRSKSHMQRSGLENKTKKMIINSLKWTFYGDEEIFLQRSWIDYARPTHIKQTGCEMTKKKNDDFNINKITKLHPVISRECVSILDCA